jgi:S-DNA-T family DNA segregation ATPase FtsK/SpoIIIE
VKKIRKKGDKPDENKNVSESKKSRNKLKAKKAAGKKTAGKVANKSSSPKLNKKLSKTEIKKRKNNQEQLLRASVKITKHKSVIALILGIVFILAAVLTAGFTTVTIIEKPIALMDISILAVSILTPLISFISTATIGLYPTAIVFLVIGISLFSIRNYKPWSIVELIIGIVAIYILHLLSNQAYSNSFPQYLEIFFENQNIDPTQIAQQLIIFLIIDVVLLMLLVPICSIFNEKWQLHLIKLQIRKDKNLVEEKKQAEIDAKIKLAKDSKDAKASNESKSNTDGINFPIPVDVPSLSFINKTKIYDTNTTKENLTPFSNVPDSNEPEIISSKGLDKSTEKGKVYKGHLSKNASLDNKPFDDLHTVSISTLEMAKKNVEDRMRNQKGGSSKINNSHASESTNNNKVGTIPPLSSAVRKFMEPSQAEIDKVKAITNNLFGGTKTDSKTVKKTSDDRSSFENIMASGHLINATKNNQNPSKEKGSSISPFMNEILSKIDETPLNNSNSDNDSLENNNYYGNGKNSIGKGRTGKEENEMNTSSSQSGELSGTTKSFIDQLNASIAMHPNNASAINDKDFTDSNNSAIQNSFTQEHNNNFSVKESRATTAPTKAEKNAMRASSSEGVLSSQLSGNGNDNYIEQELASNKVAVGNYNSTAKPIGGGVLVDEKEAIVNDVKDEPLDLESSIAGLGRSRVVESARVKYTFPPLYLVKDYPETSNVIDEFTKQKAQRLIETLAEFKYNVSLRNIIKGPTVTMFEIVPDPGIRVNSITNLSDNIAMNLAAEKVRILAPIPGETAVGVEIPNSKRDIVGFKEILSRTIYNNMAIPMTIGRNLYGSCKIFDVATSPHMLIAGSTGSGKSVCINSLICSILYTRTPKQVRLIMVDPKVVELTIYNGIPHLLTPVITETKRALKALDFCIDEMERRNKMLSRMSVRNIKSYNDKIVSNKIAMEKMPYIVVIIDEFASLMSTAGKDLDDRVARLTAMSRAVGIHLVFATQRPSVDVITGVIKNNLPTRIAFGVTSSQDSRTIISTTGAENLLGKGDMLLSENGKSVTRLQGVFLSDDEVEQIVDFAKSQGPTDYIDESYFESYDEDSSDDSYDQSGSTSSDDGDDLWEAALKIVVERKSASASFLQRRLRIGYNRAARLVEEMEEKGIVGPPNGSKPRELLRYPDMVSTE